MADCDATTSLIGSPKRVVVFRALAVGDLLCAVPALRALRRAWPTAELTLVGLPWAAEFARRFARYVDRFIEFPGYPGLPEREPLIERIPDFLRQMQAERFDLAVQLHGSGTIVNPLIALWGARQTAGFTPADYYCPDERCFAPWPEQGLEIDRLLALIDFLGLPRAGDELELPLESADYQRASELLNARRNGTGRYVVVHAGASVERRRWPIERFAAVADYLAEAGIDVVLTGVASERPLAAGVQDAMRNSALDLCGKTDLGSLGAVVCEAALVVCNDTGISHVAAAVRTPSVVISTGDNPSRWAPKNAALHRVLARVEGVTTAEVCREARKLIMAGDDLPGWQTPRRPPRLATV